jgi:hypothetical protein
MGMKKRNWVFQSVVLLTTVSLMACGQSSEEAGVVGSLGVTELRGTSLGEPEGAESLFRQDYIEQSFETGEDVLSADENIDDMSDEEIEQVYAEQWETVNAVMDEMEGEESILPRVNLAMMSAATTKKITTKKKSSTKSKGSGMSGMACLGLGIQGEAGGESREGMVAVGRTLLNRAGGNLGRVCAALFAKAQFESMQKRSRKVSAASLRAAQQVAKLGSWIYDHFLNKVLQRKLGRKIPTWAVKFERKGCSSKKVGGHTFYASKHCGRAKKRKKK